MRTAELMMHMSLMIRGSSRGIDRFPVIDAHKNFR